MKSPKGENMESTLVVLKPDAVKGILIGEIISRLERKNLIINQMNIMNRDRELAL